MVPGHVSEKALSGSLRCHDGDSNENVRKISKHAAPFFAQFFAVNAQLRRELTQLHVLRERKQTTKNMNISLKKSTLGKFAYIWQSERVGTIR